ncbi:MAG: arginine repressor [Acidimicrobiia bacterium]|nr:arginine repressor [Acidimicrobiia bacterium]NNL13675.1 arginine repressor [Acidimicrobiia bacterium]
MTTTGLSKHQRQYRIAEYLQREAVTSQASIVDLLAADGIEATQATVSRDLDEMGAVKGRLPGGEVAYVVPAQPQDQVAPAEHLRRICREWVAAIDSSNNIVVVRTPPGSAHMVGSAIDRAGWTDVIGTVAGDDTVMVIAAEGVRGADVAEELRQLAGL